MENRKKRRRGEKFCLDQAPEDPVMTQSKATRRQLGIDAQIHFLNEGKHVQLQQPPRKNARQLPLYPIIIRRVHRSLD